MSASLKRSGSLGLHQLSTPRAAALAGVLFALLFGTAIVLIRLRMPEGIGDSAGWVIDQRRSILTATALMPFAGISFLWFIAVVRDGFGQYEDRFFSMVFIGSGLLFLAMTFFATAAAAGLVASNMTTTAAPVHREIVEFGKVVVLAASKTYALRMAAVFMISLATIWLKTGLMPRWLVVISYLTALTLLLASDISLWVTLVFPVWVLVVSLLMLARSGFIDQLRAAAD